MKLEFDKHGKNYIEVQYENDNISIILSSQDNNNPLNKIINSVTISKKQFIQLFSNILQTSENE